MSCNQCKRNLPIINVKHQLCNDCNYQRLHKGKSRNEVYAERSKAKPLVKYRIKQQTSKQRVIKEQLSAVKNEISLESNECCGCGITSDCLDRSHILSVKQRPDLELEKTNIQLLCRSCHQKWESYNVEKLLQLRCFEKNMHYLEIHDQSTFWRIAFKFVDFLNTQSTSSLVAREIQKLYFYTQLNNYLN